MNLEIADPGLARTGYALLKVNKTKNVVLDCGCLTTPSQEVEPKRLEMIYQKMTELINNFEPNVLVIEKLFFNQNVKTAITVGQAQGVVLLAAGASNLKCVWYTPGEAKRAVCGYGAASKAQVQEMVKRLLGLKELPRPKADTADALALAICHAAVVKFNSHVGKEQ
jgi:crossover junction endodeoxyribonuclease RuvC